MISAIFAISDNGVIGNAGGIPWHLPEDLKRFKELTWGKKVISGRKTWESLPKKPLPNRQHYVLTRDLYFIEDWANSKEKREQFHILSGLENLPIIFPKSEEVFIIGGAQVYEEAFSLDIVDRVYVTYVENTESTIIGDVWFNWRKYKDGFIEHLDYSSDICYSGNLQYVFCSYSRISQG